MVQLKQLPKPSRKGEPPQQARPTANLAKPPSEAKIPLQVKIPSETRIAFKSYALAHNIDASDLFQIVWDHYVKTKG